jgi:hypothetical protein
MGGDVGHLTNSISLISGFSETSKKLEFERSPTLALTSSFDSVDPVMSNLIMRFSYLGERDSAIPIQTEHWTNPQFKVCIYWCEFMLYMLSLSETANRGWRLVSILRFDFSHTSVKWSRRKNRR